MKPLVALFLTVVAFSPAGYAAEFLAGAASIDITPEPGLQTWGYGAAAPVTTGVLDPLHARAVVLRAGGETMAIVTLDLGRVLLPEFNERIRKRVAKEGVSHVLFTASHTHQAPFVDRDAPHTRMMEGRIGDVILQALAKLEPATIGVGRTTIDIASNRRKILENGQCMMVWRNAEQIEGVGPVDHEAGIIELARPDGSPIAILVNYACHPVVLSWDNTQYSADYVGELSRVVSEATGAECLFLQGGSGDINPYLDKTPIVEGGVEAMRGVGRTAAYAVLTALQGIHTETPATPSLQLLEEKVEVGIRWDVKKPANQEVLRKIYGANFDKYFAHLKPDLAIPMEVLLINGDLALVGVPGELFVQYQLDLKAHSPIKDTFMVGYANEFHVYFPTIKDSVARGYGAAMNSYVGAGAGDKLLTHALLAIGALMGKLSPDPTLEDFKLFEGGPLDTVPTESED